MKKKDKGKEEVDKEGKCCSLWQHLYLKAGEGGEGGRRGGRKRKKRRRNDVKARTVEIMRFLKCNEKISMRNLKKERKKKSMASG